MSLTRFHRETGETIRAGATSTLQAQERVRDLWLSAAEYQPIVAAILGNWTSGNCVDFMAPVSKALLAANLPELHRHLWARTIKRQSDLFFREYKYLRGQGLTCDAVLSVDASGFDEFDPNSYIDKRAAASFLLGRLLANLERWRSELVSNGLLPDVVDRIRESLHVLQQPRIEVGRLAPSGPSR